MPTASQPSIQELIPLVEQHTRPALDAPPPPRFFEGVNARPLAFCLLCVAPFLELYTFSTSWPAFIAAVVVLGALGLGFGLYCAFRHRFRNDLGQLLFPGAFIQGEHTHVGNCPAPTCGGGPHRRS